MQADRPPNVYLGGPIRFVVDPDPVRDSVYVVEVGNDLNRVVDRPVVLALQRARRLLDADEPDVRHSYARSFSAIDWSSFQAMPGLLSTSGRKSHGVIP